jgi:Zn-dependent peptidase ImmA (M78 family)/transcriptional regulator with XRE-family HTH domain
MNNSSFELLPVGAKESRAFVGARLEIARTFKAFTLKTLAEEVSVSWGLLGHYERGERKQPSPDLVAALAKALGVTPDFFFTPLNDVWKEAECSFRHRVSTAEAMKKRARAHGTLFGDVLRELMPYVKYPKYNVPSIAAKTALEIEAAADRCRDHWRLGFGPITQIGRVAEGSAGVVLVKNLEHADKIDAFARRGEFSTIILNTARTSTSRWIFDIAHELGHFVLHEGLQTGSKETEEQANYFASAFLLPKRTFSASFRSRSLTWPHILELKGKWHTSAAAIIRRSYTLGLIDPLTYRRCYQQLSTKGWIKQEPNEPSFAGPEWFASAVEIATNRKSDPLTISDLYRKLNMTPETFSAVTGLKVSRKAPVQFQSKAARA